MPGGAVGCAVEVRQISVLERYYWEGVRWGGDEGMRGEEGGGGREGGREVP